MLPAAGLSAPQRSTIGNPMIFKIVFGGKPTNPVITVLGQDLRYDPYEVRPPKNPTYTPSNQSLCPVKIHGNPGYDYGTRLTFVDRSAKPSWSAGRYRPKLGELDCIGIVITAFTNDRVEFHFGGFFRQRHYRVNPGDFVGIAINQVGTGVHVKYGGDGVNPGT
jgi:hypothetical protein